MVKVIPTRTFLLRQEKGFNGTKDVVAERGIKIEIKEEECIMFWGSLDIPEADQKKLMKLNKMQGHFLNSVGRRV